MSEPSASSRVSRRSTNRRDRHRLVIGGILVAAVVIGVSAIVIALVTRPDTPSEIAPGPPKGPPANLALFAVQDDPSLVTVVGDAPGRGSVAMPIPHDILVPLPDVGTGTIGDAMTTSGESGRSAVSNLLGAWVPLYAAVDMEGLGRVVDRSGGIDVNVPRVRLGDRTVGPGKVRMRGADVIAYLSVRDPGERSLRWQEVSAGLFAKPVELDDHSVVATNNLPAVTRFFEGVHDGTLEPLPAETVSLGLQEAKPAGVAAAIAAAFGVVHGEPTRVIVLNGVDGCIGCGLAVTDAIVPFSYQVSAYGDEAGRHQATTLILTTTRELLPQAEQIQEALGMGRVMLTKGRSGLGDLTVLVGEDLLNKIAPSTRTTEPEAVPEPEAEPTGSPEEPIERTTSESEEAA